MQTSKREIRENEYLLRTGDSLVDKRFATCLTWYIRKACRYRIGFYFCTLVSGIFPFIVAALNSCVNESSVYIRWGAVALSTGASIAVVVLTTFRFQEKWTKYRMAAEFLKRERVKFLLSKERAGNEIDQLDEEFLQTIEKYMESETADWQSANLKDTNEFKNKLANNREQGIESCTKKDEPLQEESTAGSLDSGF